MAYTMTIGAKNYILDNGFDTLLNGATLVIRSAPRPLVSAAMTGTLLWSFVLPADAFAAAAFGQKLKNGTWNANNVGSGTAAWFRFKLASDTNVVSDTQPRIDGDVTLPGNGGELTLGSLVLTNGLANEVLSCIISLLG
jgi:hypothetical protein